MMICRLVAAGGVALLAVGVPDGHDPRQHVHGGQGGQQPRVSRDRHRRLAPPAVAPSGRPRHARTAREAHEYHFAQFGGKDTGIRGGRYARYEKQPLTNLHITILEKMGYPVETLGDSTGTIQGLTDV